MLTIAGRSSVYFPDMGNLLNASGVTKIERLGQVAKALILPAILAGTNAIVATHDSISADMTNALAASGVLAVFGTKLIESAHAVESGVQAVRIHAQEEVESKKQARMINDDLARAVGSTIQVMIVKTLRKLGTKYQTRLWRDLSKVVEVKWIELARETPQLMLGSLAEQQLVTAIEYDPSRPAFPPMQDPDLWKAMLCFLAERAGIGQDLLVANPHFETIAKACDEQFRAEFYDTLKHDFETGGKAYAGITLRSLGEIIIRLRGVEARGHCSSSSPLIWTEIRGDESE